MKTALTLTLATLSALTLGAAEIATEPVTTTQDQKVSIRSRGNDVRMVLSDLFTQLNKNFVVEGVSRTELFLNLNQVEFDEALEIICRLANLRYELQNGIYIFTRARTTPATTQPHSQPPRTQTGAPRPASPTPARPAGRLAEAVLQRTVSGRFNRVDLREILKSLADQAKVTIEVDEAIPRYKLEFSLRPTSLNYALRVIRERLDLELVFTDRMSLLLRAKPSAEPLEKFEIAQP